MSRYASRSRSRSMADHSRSPRTTPTRGLVRVLERQPGRYVSGPRVGVAGGYHPRRASARAAPAAALKPAREAEENESARWGSRCPDGYEYGADAPYAPAVSEGWPYREREAPNAEDGPGEVSRYPITVAVALSVQIHVPRRYVAAAVGVGGSCTAVLYRRSVGSGVRRSARDMGRAPSPR